MLHLPVRTQIRTAQLGSIRSTGLGMFAATQTPARPRWPMIVLRTPKGWTGPKFVDGKAVEGSWRSHQVPIAEFKTPGHVQQLEDWLRSYRPQELFDDRGRFRDEFAALAPTGKHRT